MTRALVVDDNAPVRLLVARVLEEMGWSVAQAGGGTDGLFLAQRGPIGLLVTDVSLGGASGLWLAGQVRRLHPDARVLLMSGHEREQVARMALGEGLACSGGPIEAFLRKPFGVSELRDTVMALLCSPSPPS